MVSKTIKITNEEGMHMRPATILSQTMAGFKSKVDIKFNGNSYDAKSVMMLMAACIKKGHEIEIVAEGEDEQEALNKAVEIIESGLGD